MKLRPQVQLRFRDAEQFLAVKARAAGHGLSVNEWILQRIEHKAPSLRGEGVMPSDGVRELAQQNTQRAVTGDHRAETSGEAHTIETPSCPEDGELLVWNKVLKRWVCECGYQGQKTA